MKEIGIGVIGTGFMGKAHSVAYSASASVFGTGLRPRLEIVCDLSPQRASQRATDLGFSRYSADWREVVGDPAVELVSVCAPNDTHAEMAITALRAGKHVWCEKPMSTSIADSQKMTEAAAEAAGKTIIGYNYTKNPAVTHARRLIEAGAIGRVFAFFSRYDVDNEADTARPWTPRFSRELYGTGANGDILSHVISMAHYLTGDTIRRVVADALVVHRERTDPKDGGKIKPVDNEDTISALVQFANGARGHIGAGRATWGRKCGFRWEVQGTKGTIAFDQERLNELRVFTRQEDPATDGFRVILTGPQHPPYSAFLPNGGHGLGYMDVKICELHELLRSIETGAPAWPAFADGLVIEKVIDAVDRSAQRGEWVEVDEG